MPHFSAFQDVRAAVVVAQTHGSTHAFPTIRGLPLFTHHDQNLQNLHSETCQQNHRSTSFKNRPALLAGCMLLLLKTAAISGSVQSQVWHLNRYVSKTSTSCIFEVRMHGCRWTLTACERSAGWCVLSTAHSPLGSAPAFIQD